MNDNLTGIEIVHVTRNNLEEYVNIHNHILPVQYPQKWYEDFFTTDNRIALAAIDNTINIDDDGVENSNKNSSLVVNNWCIHLEKKQRVKIVKLGNDIAVVKDYYGNQENCPIHVLRPIKSKIIGFASGRIDLYDTTSLCSYFCCRSEEGRRGYIMSLGCLKSHRRRGIGTYILDKLMEVLSNIGCDSFSLHCTVMNSAAIQLYEWHGFETVGFLQEYYHFHGKFHDAYHLVLKNENQSRHDKTKYESIQGGMQLLPKSSDDTDIRYRKHS
jgi:ribosomal protein S18 acetylase RimI-like enzyme